MTGPFLIRPGHWCGFIDGARVDIERAGAHSWMWLVRSTGQSGTATSTRRGLEAARDELAMLRARADQ